MAKQRAEETESCPNCAEQEMTTVLIILLAYPIATVALNILACAMISFMLRRGDFFEKLIASLLFHGISLKTALYPLWLWILLVSLPLMGKISYWICVSQLPRDMKRVVVFYTPEWLWVRRS